MPKIKLVNNILLASWHSSIYYWANVSETDPALKQFRAAHSWLTVSELLTSYFSDNGNAGIYDADQT